MVKCGISIKYLRYGLNFQQLYVKEEVSGGPLKRPLNTDNEDFQLTYDYTALVYRVSRICVNSLLFFQHKTYIFPLISLFKKYEKSSLKKQVIDSTKIPVRLVRVHCK